MGTLIFTMTFHALLHNRLAEEIAVAATIINQRSENKFLTRYGIVVVETTPSNPEPVTMVLFIRVNGILSPRISCLQQGETR